MEINAKIASLEDEVKLLKGEVKLILSEIRAAILGQDNPFAEPGQGLRADPGALESRPPIKVVRVPSEDDEPEAVEEPPQKAPQAIWEEDAETNEPEPAMAEEPPVVQKPQEPAPAPVTPIATRQAPVQPPIATARSVVEPVSTPTPPAPAMPAPAPAPTAATPESGMPRWSLLTVAGLAVWAEEAVKTDWPGAASHTPRPLRVHRLSLRPREGGVAQGDEPRPADGGADHAALGERVSRRPVPARRPVARRGAGGSAASAA